MASFLKKISVKNKNRLTCSILVAFAGGTFWATLLKMKQSSAEMEFSNNIPAKDAVKNL